MPRKPWLHSAGLELMTYCCFDSHRNHFERKNWFLLLGRITGLGSSARQTALNTKGPKTNSLSGKGKAIRVPRQIWRSPQLFLQAPTQLWNILLILGQAFLDNFSQWNAIIILWKQSLDSCFTHEPAEAQKGCSPKVTCLGSGRVWIWSCASNSRDIL